MSSHAVSAAPDAWIHARRSRDSRFDGLFFIAVRSTGIYCRPVCPAPSPKEANVRYYAHAAQAAADGFRPCLRCRPELAPGLAPCDSGERSFDLAWRRLCEGALDDGSVAELAAEVGIGERQLRRQFLQRLGLTPKAWHDHRRLLLAKQLISETALPLTEVAFAAGFNSLRRFNQAFLDECGMPPSRIRGSRARAGGDVIELRLGYRPPYDLEGVLGFLAQRAVAGVERVRDGGYERVIAQGDRAGWLRVEPIEGAHALRLRLPVALAAQLPEWLRRVRRLFDLDADPAAIADTLARDPRLAAALARAPGRRVPGAFDGFETAVRAVLGQQVSVAAARTLCSRLVQRWGEPVAVAGLPDARRFPRPEALATADVAAIGLPAARARTIAALAAAVRDRHIDLERAQPLEDWVDRLCALPGIGPWSAHYMAMRCLHHPDAFPAGDLVVRKRIGGGVAASERAATQAAAPWRPWRAYAVMHLWAESSPASHEQPT